VSCNKYLDVQPKGVKLLETVNDYDQWLNSSALETTLSNELNWLADNIDYPEVSNPPIYLSERVYTWQSQFSLDIKSSPAIWADRYKCIYYFNTAIEGIDNATTGTESQKKSLKAEALLGRAFEYLYLVNLYSKPYDTATADEDLAVPFVTSNDINKPVPDRSTVNEIYAHIIADITAALPDLPQNNSQNRFRGSVASAYSVLARTYLYMGDYTKAAQNAQLALDNGPDEILDYSTMASAEGISNLAKREDAIYARLNNVYSQEEIPTLAFLRSFDTTDLRLRFYYTDLGDYSFTTRGQTRYLPYSVSYNSAYSNWGTSVAEMRLILAETAARANELATACNQLDLVRKCRFPADTYEKFESTNQEEVLQKVLQERTFEFAYCGLRWLDMRRLDAEGRMPAVSRYDGSNNIIATLSPGSMKYTLQIPLQVMYFNSGWLQNPWEED
jgi:hypothetical protein